MLLYDKKSDSIDVYTIEEKIEDLKRFRKSVIQRHRKEIEFNIISTNCEETIKQFMNQSEISWNDIDYDNSTPLDHGTYSGTSIMPFDDKMNVIFDRYIDGEYDKNHLTTVFMHKFDMYGERKWIKETMCNLLITEGTSISSMNSHGYNYELPYLMDLPDSLYLLHLLQQGRFEELTNEKISRQLGLFDIQFLKNVKLNDIREMIETGLVKGTVEDAILKAETGSKILQKVRR